MFTLFSNPITSIRLWLYTREVRARVIHEDDHILETTLNEYTDVATELYRHGYEIGTMGGRTYGGNLAHSKIEKDLDNALWEKWLDQSGSSINQNKMKQIKKAADKISEVLNTIYAEIRKRNLVITRSANRKNNKDNSHKLSLVKAAIEQS